MKRVLIVDDERGMRAALEARFLRRGWAVDTAADAKGALEKFRSEMHPLIVTDIRMPGDDGLSLMRAARSLVPTTAVILLTAYASVPEAVEAIKDGACDYLIKPISFEQLETAAKRILEQAVGGKKEEKGLIGHSLAWMNALDRARQAAASDADVLIEAESGTGKELVARMIHRLSRRSKGPFVAINCAALPEDLLESELFGHSKGAFTGAASAKPGKIERAHGGTLMLDEIGEMPLILQPKLLRALQEREFDRLGDTHSTRVDIRVIATTNRSLLRLVEEGAFRSDLYYRLNVIPLRLPPLRERQEDIRELAEFFLHLYSPSGNTLRLTSESLQKLESHPWPGNVRELENCIRRAVALSGGSEIAVMGLDGLEAAGSFSTRSGDSPTLRPGVSLGEMERKLVEMTLHATGGNRSKAAELLGVSLRTVRNKVRSYGLPSWSSYVHQ